MLDDLKYIHAKDSSDALGIVARQWEQLNTSFDLPKLDIDVDHVVFAGMGGSALCAQLAAIWPGCKVPIEIWRRYDAPKYIGKKTLLIAASYSGNSEETLSAVAAAEKAGSHIVMSAGGGKLIEIAKAKGYPYTLMPPMPQPRFGTMAGLLSLITILQQAGLTHEQDAVDQLRASAEYVKKLARQWQEDVPTDKNPAKQLALELAGTSPVVYAAHTMSAVAYKWKISFNENAKNVAWWNEVPEFSHNEFIGWTSHPVDKPYSVVELRSSFEHERNLKRLDVSQRLLSGKRPHAHVVDMQGSTVLEHVLYGLVLGDFVSLYLALLNGVDPTPVTLVDKMKQALD